MSEKAFLLGTHRYSFRAGEPAEIIGVEFVTPEGLDPRACYKVRFEDGTEDFVPVSESEKFEIIPYVRTKHIPDVTN